MHPADECEEVEPSRESSVDWCVWLREHVRAAPIYPEHRVVLEACCDAAERWRERFGDRSALWSRIRGGGKGRLAKELIESAPVLSRVLSHVESMELLPDADPARPEGEADPRLVILDLCSGFGYLGMFLSELLPPSKVGVIVLIDIRWAPHNVARQPHHLSDAHLTFPGWPIRLTSSRADLKTPSDRRGLARTFLSGHAPALLLAIHLCARRPPSRATHPCPPLRALALTAI